MDPTVTGTNKVLKGIGTRPITDKLILQTKIDYTLPWPD